MTGPWAPRVVVSPSWAMSFVMPPSAVTSTSSIIIRITTVHPFATLWPSSPKGDARSVTGLAVCVICDTDSQCHLFSRFPLRWQRNWICKRAKRPENPVTCFPPGRSPAKRERVYKAEHRCDTLSLFCPPIGGKRIAVSRQPFPNQRFHPSSHRARSGAGLLRCRRSRRWSPPEGCPGPGCRRRRLCPWVLLFLCTS